MLYVPISIYESLSKVLTSLASETDQLNRSNARMFSHVDFSFIGPVNILLTVQTELIE